MAAVSAPCRACGQPVPAGRASCPNCGAIVDGTPSTFDTHTAAEPPIEEGTLETGGLASAGVSPVGVAPGGAVPGGLVPGAYMPPSSVHRPEQAAVPPPQMPLAASPAVGSPSPPPTAGWSPPASAAIQPQLTPGRASLFADLPFDAPDSLTEWLVAIGSSVSAVSFLLPWISGTTTYVTSWGLGSPSRFPILALLIITAVLGILPNRVAAWVRSGLLGLISGSLFLGNVWPIIAGDYGPAAFGAIVAGAAAIVLIAGGILAVAPRREASQPG
jgi:hypothetical protein